MDKLALAKKITERKAIDKNKFIMQKCLGKTVLDLGCIRHSAEFALSDVNWLHKKIKSVAKQVLGVDYLSEEADKLSAHGYVIKTADVTKPLELNEKFDVIVAGDLIEHLNNFAGFFENCQKLLADDGELIITTANPFFGGQFHYVSFKNEYFANPEHTCWVDPLCLLQLSGRFGLELKEAYFIDSPWRLSNLICESENHRFDILKNNWSNNTLSFKLRRIVFKVFFEIFYFPFQILTRANAPLVKSSDYLAVLKKIHFKEN